MVTSPWITSSSVISMMSVRFFRFAVCVAVLGFRGGGLDSGDASAGETHMVVDGVDGGVVDAGLHDVAVVGDLLRERRGIVRVFVLLLFEAPFEDDGHLLSLRIGVVPVRESVGEEIVVAGVLLFSV
jgi:hypothetical protein